MHNFIFTIFFKIVATFILSVSAHAQSPSKPEAKTDTKKVFTSPSDKFIDEILADTPSDNQAIPPEEEIDTQEIISNITKTPKPTKDTSKKLPNDTDSSEDFVDDPEALLDEITKQIDTDTLINEDDETLSPSSDTSSATGRLNTPSEKNGKSDLPDTFNNTEPKGKRKDTPEQDFFSVIDTTAPLKTPNKELILEEEPDNNGIDATTTPTAIDNDILLEAVDTDHTPSNNSEPEFSDDITDKSLRKFSNPLKEPSDSASTKDINLDDSTQTPPSDNFSDDMFKIPDDVNKIFDTSDAQTKQTGIIPNTLDMNEVYKPFNKNQEDKKAKDKKTKKPNSTMVFNNQSFVCQFEETIDSANQEQSYKLTLTPQDDTLKPIVLMSKSKMELHQFFDANTESNSRSQIEFSILQNFCSKIIVQKSVSEAY